VNSVALYRRLLQPQHVTVAGEGNAFCIVSPRTRRTSARSNIVCLTIIDMTAKPADKLHSIGALGSRRLSGAATEGEDICLSLALELCISPPTRAFGSTCCLTRLYHMVGQDSVVERRRRIDDVKTPALVLNEPSTMNTASTLDYTPQTLWITIVRSPLPSLQRYKANSIGGRQIRSRYLAKVHSSTCRFRHRCCSRHFENKHEQ
jgi:hypothetical protein